MDAAEPAGRSPIGWDPIGPGVLRLPSGRLLRGRALRPADRAVELVRRGYDRHAVETPWQRRYVARFAERVAAR